VDELGFVLDGVRSTGWSKRISDSKIFLKGDVS